MGEAQPRSCGKSGSIQMKNSLKLILFIVTISCYAAALSRATEPFNTPERTVNSIVTDTTQYVILTFDKQQSWLFKNAKPGSLSEADIEDIQSILEKCLSIYNHTQKNIFDSLSKAKPGITSNEYYFVIDLKRYKRQYIPVINEKGQKEVWVNCFCRAYYKDWLKEIISVRDGGNCYFNLKINLTLKTFYDFSVNGEA